MIKINYGEKHNFKNYDQELTVRLKEIRFTSAIFEIGIWNQ